MGTRTNITRREKFFEVISKARARRAAAIMGVCNVTPDSFSDGGKFLSRADAFAHVDALLEAGADIVDIGGESTRPGSKPVDPREQLSRVLEVVRYAADKAGSGRAVSIDTTSAEVAHACLDAGALCVNDVSNLRDPALADVAFGAGAALILSHARQPQSEMQGYGGVAESEYDDVVPEVLADFQAARKIAEGRGVPHGAIVMDPGLGFSKTARHSMELLRRTAELVSQADAPVLIGASRKSFLALIDQSATADQRLGSSILAADFAARSGAAIVRVHDVRETRQALDLSVVLCTHRGHGDTVRPGQRAAARSGGGVP